MRGLQAVAASLVAHAGVLVALRHGPSPSPPAFGRPPSDPVPAPTVAIVEPIAIEVIPLPEPAPAAAAPDLPGAPTAAGAGSRIASRGGRAATDEVATGAPDATEGPATSGHVLRMRRPARRELHVDGAGLAAIATARAPEAVAPVPRSGKLEPAGGGRQVVNDAVTTMHVEPDGSAHFADKPDAEIHWALPIPSAKGIGRMLEAWYRDPYAQAEAPAIAELPQHEQAVPGGWDSGSRSGGGGGGGGIPIVGGSFDITAWAMRKAGIDPYQARKQKLLETTYDERVEQHAVHADAQRQAAEELVRRNLNRLWAEVTDPAARRRALFELWDECEEGEGPAAEAGGRARRQIVGFIRAHLPADATGAYTADELAELNAGRTSHQRFDPY